MLSSDQLVSGLLARDSALRAGFSGDSVSGLSDEDDYPCWTELEAAVSGLSEAFASDDDKTIVHLVSIDELARSLMCRRYSCLFEHNIPEILLSLAAHEHGDFREYALTALVNMSATVTGFVDQLSDDGLSRAVSANPDPNEAAFGHILRLLANVIVKRSSVIDYIPLETTLQGALSYCDRFPDSAGQYFLYRVTGSPSMSLDSAEPCVRFIDEFLKKKIQCGIVFVYLAIHNLLNCAEIPFECRIQFAERLFLCEILDDELRKVDKSEASPLVAVLYALLGDLFALQLTQSTMFLSPHLDLLRADYNTIENAVLTVNWIEIELYWAIVKIVENCDSSTLDGILKWRNHILVSDLAVKVNDGPEILRVLALRCLKYVLDEVCSDDVIVAMSSHIVEQLLMAVVRLQNVSAAKLFVRIVDLAVDRHANDVLACVLDSVKRCGGLANVSLQCRGEVESALKRVIANARKERASM